MMKRAFAPKEKCKAVTNSSQKSGDHLFPDGERFEVTVSEHGDQAEVVVKTDPERQYLCHVSCNMLTGMNNDKHWVMFRFRIPSSNADHYVGAAYATGNYPPVEVWEAEEGGMDPGGRGKPPKEPGRMKV